MTETAEKAGKVAKAKKSDHPEFAARLELAANEADEALSGRGRNSEFARRIKRRIGDPITADTARRWFEGISRPRYSRIPAIAEILGVNAEWLESGKGPMRPPVKVVTETYHAGLEGRLADLSASDNASIDSAISALKAFRASLPETDENVRLEGSSSPERDREAANYLASAISLSGTPCRANGSAVLVTLPTGEVSLHAQLVSPGQSGVTPLRLGSATAMVIQPQGGLPSSFAVIPVNAIPPGLPFRVDDSGTSVEVGGVVFPATRSISALLSSV